VLGALAVGAAMALASCNIAGPAFYLIHGPDKVKKLYELDKKKTAVVFIDDRANHVPRRATRVAIGEEAEQTLLKEKAVKDMVSSQSAIQAAGTDREAKPAAITEIGSAVKADIVIYATVDEFTISRDGQTFSPGATLRVKVVDVAQGKRLWPENAAGQLMTVRLSAKTDDLPTSTAGRFAAEDELARETGMEIAWLFVDHEPTHGVKDTE
jgi:hypothetical protein